MARCGRLALMAEVYDIRAAVADALKSTDAATAPVRMTIEFTGGAAGLLDQLTGLLGRDRGRVIAEALAFFYVGVGAQREGMQMAVVDRDGSVQATLDLLTQECLGPMEPNPKPFKFSDFLDPKKFD